MDSIPELAPFIQIAKRMNIGLAIFAGVLLIAAGGSLTIPGDEFLGKLLLTGFLGGLGTLFGGMAVRDLVRPHPGVEVLRHRPQDVAWISPVKTSHEGGHLGTNFVLYLHDGTKVSVYVRPKHEAEAIRTLKTRCPQADYGYSPDLVAKHAKPGHGVGANAWAPVPSGDAAIEPLLHALVKDGRLLLWFGIPCIAAAGLFVAVFITGSDPVPEVAVVVIAVVLALVGGQLVRVALRPVHRHPLVRALREEGSSIKSIRLDYVSFSYGTDVMPQLRVDTTTRGKLFMVVLAPGTEKPLLAELRQRLPHAFEGSVVSEVVRSL